MIRKHKARSGKVSYYVYVTDQNGKPLYVGKRPTKDEAKNLEASKRSLVVKVKEGDASAAVLCRHTLAEAYDLVKGSLSPRSRTQYDHIMVKQVLPRIGEHRLRSLTTVDVEALRDDLLGHYGPGTVKSTLAALGAVFKECLKRDWIERSPVRGVRRPMNPSAGQYDWLHTAEDISAMLRAARREVRPLLAFLVFTGCRIGEAVHLQWTDIDLDRRLILVHRGRHGTTKSGKPRHVPILDPLLPVMRSMLPEVGKPSGLVFPGADGKVRDLSVPRRALRRALARAGLDTGLRVHDLRHTFASHWMMSGGDIFKLSKILGHSSVQMTEVYAHLAPSAFDGDWSRISVPHFDLDSGASARVVPLPKKTKAKQRPTDGRKAV